MSELNQLIDVSRQFEPQSQRASMQQDNANKTAFVLNLISRMPQEPPKPEEPPRIPNLGALAIPS